MMYARENALTTSHLMVIALLSLILQSTNAKAQSKIEKPPLQISGVYPHLAVFNDHSTTIDQNGTVSNYSTYNDGGECGIGAVVPWAGKLWMVTYSPHRPLGSSDKLYSIDSRLQLTTHPESIGGTPANRMIHRESKQLLMGPYLIDSSARIRTIPYTVMPGRLTATARHLFDPANMVYYFDMEGKIYEANVHTLAVKKLFEKPVPGWHGKGAYTAQHQFILANNGEEAVFKIDKNLLQAGDLPKDPEDKGVLASWDGKDWKIIQRKQFTDVTGPGGIYGAPNDAAPLWSIGWDKRSVLLALLDAGKWYTYRLPKAAHTYDHRGGWYTEWPRIRAVSEHKMLMDMHAMFYDFPSTFSHKNSGGLRPISSHLRYIPDFCGWNDKLVLATDETTIMENPMAGRSQSNLWFGNWNDLKTWGPADGWGGPWMNDSVQSNTPSDPFLVSGFEKRILHLADSASQPVRFTLEIDKAGNNQWESYQSITIAPNGYGYVILPEAFQASWIRVRTDRACRASAFFHYQGKPAPALPSLFSAITSINDTTATNGSWIRPSSLPNTNLQVLQLSGKKQYTEVNQELQFLKEVVDSTANMEKLLGFEKHYQQDAASVIVKDNTGTFRLPFTSDLYNGFSYRDKRELESERFMLNIQGTIYEVGRESGFAAIRPVTTHKKKIIDFCTWRGLLVISGTRKDAKADRHYFAAADGSNGLWFGAIDDLWKMGKPRGEGGVWKNTAVQKGERSLPFLMTGYDKKTVLLKADKDVNISLEIDFDLSGFHHFKTIHVPAGKTIVYRFPPGFNAHWVRAVADQDCKATVWLQYE
ncbi:MAG TPA: hypothetical protein VL307_14460 [Chitinophagaceae bacterium]|nr:hypothetical protein [Chitinophagaceae bacterium]